MEVFVARQPILTRQQTVFGYELLFRSGLANYFQAQDPTAASVQVVDNSYFVFGLATMTAGARAFINFTRDILLDGYAKLLPCSSLVVEVLEDVEPDDEIVKACRDLKAAGYCLALDDYVLLDNSHPLLPLIDILKIDFMALSDEERRAIPRILGAHKMTFLAEKVETAQDFALAREAGYSYFQGYFFAKPTILTGHKPEGLRVNNLTILQEARRPDINFDRLESLIKRETSLVYKLLRYVNSAAMGLSHRVTSIKHALLLMGEENVRRLVCLMVLGDLIGDRPPELIRLSAVRASFCETVAVAAGWSEHASEVFLLGLFSLLDAIINVPIEDAIRDLPLPEAVAGMRFRGKDNSYRVLLDLMVASEQGDWQMIDRCAAQLNVRRDVLATAYSDSMQWADAVLH